MRRWTGPRSRRHGTTAAHPGERLYAAAFHLFCGDGTKILPPALAVNTEAALEAAHDAAMARVCKTMTATARQNGIHDSLPRDFVVIILEGQRGNEEEAALIRESIDQRVLPTVPERRGVRRIAA